LERSGIEIVPTIFVESGRPFDLTVECTSRGWDDVVIKPCIGGSSYGARRVRGGEIAAGGVPHLQALLGNAEAMVQPFLHETETAGELACIFIDGTFTHAVRKPPFNSSTETTSEHVCELTADDRSFVNRIVGSLARVPAYARVDIVPTALGTLLMELELIEPSLYFALEPSAAQRLAERVLRMPAPSS
jgi:glutathione synthase/RimK-type ligase-like ATP-grasp enzyme